ncbi:MAG: aldehyde dehydrogenase family protein [Deltaproteobacteria bacterium]|nr:aldehyde dehydrogenase family protein [Deltaproteobacteria bacterium]
MTALQHGSAAIPEAKASIPATSQDEIDEALAVLSDKKDAWVGLSIDERIRILDVLIDSTTRVADRWVRAACEAKGIRRGTPAEGEEWLGGPAVVLRNMQLLKKSLKDIRDHGSPKLNGEVTVRPDGQVVAPVFPTDNIDKLLFTGFSAEIWMDKSVTKSTLQDNMAEFYRNKPKSGRVSLVLGAGNVSSIGPMDALYKLFAEGEVVILKMNPVNEYLGPFMDEAFRELVRLGYFRVVYGGAKEGDYLCTHDLVGSIHITGSDKTYDAIVWGLGKDGEERKRRNEPRNDKPISAELGNVTPIIVVPGPWTEAELDYQGVNLASSLTNNAGFNCNATRVIVTHGAWAKRQALLDSIKRAFSRAEPRMPYYPGAEDRQEAFLKEHPDAHQFGPRGDGKVPWTLVSDLDPTKEDDICFTTEAWCGVTSEVPLEAESVVEYIEKAVEMANETLWGSLSCSIIVHPKTMKDPRVAKAIDKAIADLRYGSVAVNHWSALAYALVTPAWGAFPGHTKDDIRSGEGAVHNTYLFDKPEKSVIRGPFMVKPKPTWFLDNRTAHEIGKKLTGIYAKPSLAKIPSLLWSALRG